MPITGRDAAQIPLFAPTGGCCSEVPKSWPNCSNYWKRRGRTVTTWIPSLDEASAHMVEQAVIDFVGRFEKHQGSLANKINSIGPKGPLAPQYVEFLKKVEELLGQ